MIYREINYEKDAPEVVALLRTSLSDRHTKSYFLWKHTKNPFGQSYGLLACDHDKIVGARMFMFWEFQKNNKTIKAIRPVDTIIHPNYRGRGLFKKLTLYGLHNCRNSYELVFNTPNSASLPGYLKMGWEKYPQKLQYKVGLIFPGKLSKKVMLKTITVKEVNLPLIKNIPFWRTRLTEEYIKWRYVASIYKKTFFRIKNGQGYVIYRVDKLKGLKTLIIIEYIGEIEYCSEVIKCLGAKMGIFLIYFLDNELVSLKPLLSINRQLPVVVQKEDKYFLTSNLLFSSGDLEGRL